RPAPPKSSTSESTHPKSSPFPATADDANETNAASPPYSPPPPEPRISETLPESPAPSPSPPHPPAPPQIPHFPPTGKRQPKQPATSSPQSCFSPPKRPFPKPKQNPRHE